MRRAITDAGSDTFIIGGSRVTILRSDTQTAGAYCLLSVTTPAGSTTLPHMHMLEWEAIFGIAGTVRAELGGTERAIESGLVATFPPGIAHRIANVSDAEAHYLLFCAPAGFDDFVREVGAPSQPGAPVSPERPQDEVDRLRIAAPRHGLTLLPEEALKVRNPRAGLLPPAHSELINIFGTEIVVLTVFGREDESPALLRAIVPPGAVVPLHSQPDPETVYIVEGRINVFRGDAGRDNWLTIEAGGVIDIPVGVAHAYHNTSDHHVEAFVVTNHRMVEYLRAIGSPADFQQTSSNSPILEEARRRTLAAYRFDYPNGTVEQNAEIGLLVGKGIPRSRLH